jgi:hypothetical protein
MRASRTCIRRSAVARALACAVLLAAVAPPVAAQQGADSVVVSVLTMGPGHEIFERFGHISIRVRDFRTGTDTAYNWGMFDFNQPRFIQRFLTGDTQYWMAGYPSLWLIEQYRAAGRWVTEQDLALTPLQADSLARFIRWNAREEHKWYRYDYYRDNCSTRVRDALDMVLGGELKRATAGRKHGVSYRGETLRLAEAFAALNFGMDFALGRRADSTLSAWEEMFIPMRLVQIIRDARVTGADGASHPLVRAERRLVIDDRFAEAETEPELFWSSLLVGLFFAGAFLVMSMLNRRVPLARWGLIIGASGWHFLAGCTGLIVLVLGVFTRHVYMSQNSNLLVATPLSLALAVMIPMAVRRPTPRSARAVRATSLLVAVAAAAAAALQLLPPFVQGSQAVLAVAVPIEIALAFALWRATVPTRGGAA